MLILQHQNLVQIHAIQKKKDTKDKKKDTRIQLLPLVPKTAHMAPLRICLNGEAKIKDKKIMDIKPYTQKIIKYLIIIANNNFVKKINSDKNVMIRIITLWAAATLLK